MGLNGTILLFPKAGRPATEPVPIAKHVVEAFERLNLLLPGTTDHCQTPKPWIGVFAEDRKKGTLGPEEYTVWTIEPDRITPQMADLVYLLDVDMDGQPSAVSLPYIEISVATRALPIINYNGKTLCTTWAVVGFSYEDARYSRKIHRIRNKKHPIFKALSEVFSSPVDWAVQMG